jgi:hypothetical protein
VNCSINLEGIEKRTSGLLVLVFEGLFDDGLKVKQPDIIALARSVWKSESNTSRQLSNFAHFDSRAELNCFLCARTQICERPICKAMPLASGTFVAFLCFVAALKASQLQGFWECSGRSHRKLPI